MSEIADDLRQSVVITKNEIRKFFSGKKIMIFGSLILFIILLMTIVPYALGDGYDSQYMVAVVFVLFMAVIIELAGVLFTATSLVSEFEERTALILFTRPVKKWSIYLGKLVASIVVVVAFILVYYAYAVLFSYIVQGGCISTMWKSVVMTIVGVFSICGISMLMSSIAKKGSTASIMTMVVLMLLFDLVAEILNMFANIETWWSLEECLDGIMYALGPFSWMGTVTTLTDSELLRSGIMMIFYGVVSNIAAYIIFKRRDF